MSLPSLANLPATLLPAAERAGTALPLRCRRPRCRRPGPPGGLARGAPGGFPTGRRGQRFRRRAGSARPGDAAGTGRTRRAGEPPRARRTAQSVAGAAGGLRRRGRTRSAPATFPHTPATAHHLARPDPPRRAGGNLSRPVGPWPTPASTWLASGSIGASASSSARRSAGAPANRSGWWSSAWASWARWNSTCRRTST